MVNRILFVALYLIRNFLQSCLYYIHFPMSFILFSIYNLLSSESILYFSFYFIAVLFFLLYVALVSLKGFLLGTFTLLLQLLSRKISAISFLETCLVFSPPPFFFPPIAICNFLFQKISMLLFLLQQLLVLETILQRYTSISGYFLANKMQILMQD